MAEKKVVVSLVGLKVRDFMLFDGYLRNEVSFAKVAPSLAKALGEDLEDMLDRDIMEVKLIVRGLLDAIAEARKAGN